MATVKVLCSASNYFLIHAVEGSISKDLISPNGYRCFFYSTEDKKSSKSFGKSDFKVIISHEYNSGYFYVSNQ